VGATGYDDEALARKLVERLFAARSSVGPADAYRVFRPRDPRIEQPTE